MLWGLMNGLRGIIYSLLQDARPELMSSEVKRVDAATTRDTSIITKVENLHKSIDMSSGDLIAESMKNSVILSNSRHVKSGSTPNIFSEGSELDLEAGHPNHFSVFISVYI